MKSYDDDGQIFKLNGIVFYMSPQKILYYGYLHKKRFIVVYDVEEYPSDKFYISEYKRDYVANGTLKQTILAGILPEIYYKNHDKDELIKNRNDRCPYIERAIVANKIEQLTEEEIDDEIRGRL